jgi:hypothetical protein
VRRPGRKSSASLGVVVDVRQQRPEPPDAMDAERAIWHELVERYRPGWFDGSEHLLEVYVGLLATERFVAAEIARVRAHDPRDHHKLGSLVATQKQTVMAIGNLSGKLRCSVRSSFDRYAPKLASTLPKPWDLGSRPGAPGAALRRSARE